MPSERTDSDVPQVAETTIYDWKWYYSVPGYGIWLALVFAMVVPQSNRSPSVFLILAPVVIVNFTWLLLEKITSMPSTYAVQFGTVWQSVVAATAVLWLTGGYLRSLARPARLLLSLLIAVGVGSLGILSYAVSLSRETALLFVLSVLVSLTMLTAITLTAAVSKGKHHTVRFMLWLALWMLLGSMLTTFVFFVAGSLIMSSQLSWSQFTQALLMLTIAGPVLGLGLYVLNLPFMILGFANPFFRERLCGCLGLKSQAAVAMPADTGDIAD